MADATKFHFELNQEQTADVYASIMVASQVMIEQDGATPKQIFEGLRLLKFAEQWHKMFHSQFLANAPVTETKN